MRIVAGKWRGRRIRPPDDDRVRPTADRVREAWMSIVSPWIPEARVLDLYAGSGALGLEALSRGAAEAHLVDTTPASLRCIRENADALGAGAAAVIHRADALRFVKGLDAHAFDIAFADPPYGQGGATQIAEAWLAVPFADILGVEHRRDEHLPGDGERRVYGDTVITIFRVA
ncbi:MAG TPA: RsmD family RNA methyltransferase [Gemmatimonadaceae bacterium]|nr:RsmD family RNA methyltransferase [Gemmatimonadaceae bacterium]